MITYTTAHRILARIERELKRADISEMDIIEWIGEALEHLGVSLIYDPAIAFVEVKNHQCLVPSGTERIIQIARNNNFAITPNEVASEVTSDPIISNDGIDIPVRLDCAGMPIDALEVAYYRPYFDLIGEFNIGGLVSRCGLQFTPVRLSTHSFFNSIVCREDDFDNLYTNVRDEYTIIGDIGKAVLRFSFEEGQVAISYLKTRIDCESGYPVIPDKISVVTAITSYIKMKIMERDFYNHREGSQMTLAKAEQDWHWYCGQAKNIAIMPKSLDEWENLLQQRNVLIPRKNRYNTFFGKLADTESRRLIQ